MDRYNGASQVEVDLDSLRHNLSEVRRHIRADCAIVGVVKADAYGHGALAVSRALFGAGVTQLGVARVEEGLALRETGIRDAAILVMGGMREADAEWVVRYRLEPAIFGLDCIKALERAASAQNALVSVHIKVDSGMGRLGLKPQRLGEFLQKITAIKHVAVRGIMTHFASAESDPEFTARQLGELHHALKTIPEQRRRKLTFHACNSAAILTTQAAHFDVVRSGTLLYGHPPASDFRCNLDLKPILSWKTEVLSIKEISAGDSVGYGRLFTAARDSRVAVLPVGYADGFTRALSNKASVLIGGKRAPIIGWISMNMMTVDITEHRKVSIGDEAVLLGRQGAETITAWELADLIGTDVAEILCAIKPHIRRTHKETLYEDRLVTHGGVAPQRR
ncbi:MAG: alanine racemase [Gammaproteobacteria bacterium]